jgi:hypothetical protein
MTNSKTLIALSTAIALALLGAASVAQASNENDERGGYVLPGSTDGVNPVFHPEWFGKGRNGDAFGYAPISTHKHKAANSAGSSEERDPG